MGILSKIANYLYGMGSNVNTAPKVVADYGQQFIYPKDYGQRLQQLGRQKWVKANKKR